MIIQNNWHIVLIRFRSLGVHKFQSIGFAGLLPVRFYIYDFTVNILETGQQSW